MSEMPRLRELAALLQPKRLPEDVEPQVTLESEFKRITEECQALAERIGGISHRELQSRLWALEDVLFQHKDK
jgi:hypothetical protein